MRAPRSLLAREFGLRLPAATAVRVHDSTADCRYLVIPARPDGTDGWTEAELAALVSRDAMIGVALADSPSARAEGGASGIDKQAISDT